MGAGVRVSQAEYARMRGVSKQAVGKAVASGRIRLVDGMIDVDEANREWRRNTDQGLQRDPEAIRNGKAEAAESRAAAPTRRRAPAEDVGDDDAGAPGTLFQTHRAIREAWNAKLARLKVEELSGQLVRRDEVREELFRVGRKIRDMLAGIPDRCAPVVAGIDNADDCRRVIDDEIKRALDELGAVERY